MPTVVNSVSVNEEGSLFVACLNNGLRILNMEPLVVKRTLDSNVVGSVRLCSLLHRTNLIALVGGSSSRNGIDPKDDDFSKFAENSVLIWDDAQRRFVLEFTFASRVLALRTTRDRLFVVERSRIHAFTYPDPVRRLFTVETRDNLLGLCEVTPSTTVAAVQILAFPSHKVGSVQLLDLSVVGNGGNESSSTTTSIPSSQLAKNGTSANKKTQTVSENELKKAESIKIAKNSSNSNCDKVEDANKKNNYLFDIDSDNEEDGYAFWGKDSNKDSDGHENEANNDDEIENTIFDNHQSQHYQQSSLSITDTKPGVSISPTTISAHQTEVACLALNRRGTLLATASQKGTLIRVFRTISTSENHHIIPSSSSGIPGTSETSSTYIPLSPTFLTELRRGMDVATVYCIAFSPDDAFLLASSDKGTVHIFALKEVRLNRRSSLYNVVPLSQHLTALAGVTGGAAYSLAKFTLPAECACVATFGSGGNYLSSSGISGVFNSGNSNRAVYAVCVDGSYHKYVFAADGSSCEREAYDHFLDAPDEEETIML